jgi:hypothetical protein
MFMLWSTALFTGYFAFNGAIFAVESLGGCQHLRRAGSPPAPDRSSRAGWQHGRHAEPWRQAEGSCGSVRPRTGRPTVSAAARQALEAKQIVIGSKCRQALRA